MSGWAEQSTGAITLGSLSSVSGMVGDFAICSGNSMGTGGAWPSANRAIFVPVELGSWVTVGMVGASISTSAGCVDFGIYESTSSASARLIASTGALSVTGTGWVTYSFGPTTIGPGNYMLAMAGSSTSMQARRLNLIGLLCAGAAQQNTSLPLPSTSVMGASSGFVPMFGFAFRSAY